MTVPAPPAPSPRAGLPARDLALAGVYGALAVVLTVVPVGTSGVGDASPALGR